MAEDLTGGAPAPAEPTVVAETPAPAAAPAPSTVEPTPRNAVERAFAAVERGETTTTRTAAAQPVTEVAGTVDRNPDGTFRAREAVAATPVLADPTKPVQQQPAQPTQPVRADAPARFSADAKAAWAQTPPAVKGEVQRAFQEMEQGVEKYRADAEAYTGTFKPFADMAARSKMDAAATLANYVNIDMMLAKDFGAGIAQIFKNKGQDPRQWAAQIMGQPAPTPQPQDQTIAELRNEIADLRRGFGGVQQTIEQQRSDGISRSLDGFMASLPEADRTLFTELDAEIAAHLNRDPNLTLQAALAAAKQDAEARYTRLFGARASDARPPAAQQPAPAAAQTRNLQISGAPGTGSNPVTRKTPSSPRAAVDGAFAALGLG